MSPNNAAATTPEHTRTRKLFKKAASQPQVANALTDPIPAAMMIEDNSDGKQRLPKLPRAPRKPKPAQICQCGCGNQTKGGRFVPGHDARLHAWVLRVQRGVIKLNEIEHEGERAAVKAHIQATAEVTK